VERCAYPDANGVYPRHFESGAVLVQTSANPLTYERRHTDGSTEVFATPDGAVAGTRRVFLSSLVDPNGQALTFTWDAQLRLVAVTDALGQVTTLQYGDGVPLKVTGVTDPFGRIAQLTYDADGHLATVTDVITLRSSFTYGTADSSPRCRPRTD
jgi:YD repeat-containing protein